MSMRHLPLALIVWAATHFIPPAAASPTVLRSPETAQTYADNSVLWRQLRWLPGSQSLVASITFSNLNYVSTIEPRHDERFDFSLPGVKFDSRSGVFSVAGAQGEQIPIATFRRELIGRSIILLPGAQIKVLKRSGRIQVDLLASETPLPGDRWLER